ncbi:MAG: structural protein [Rhodospirillales bacterium]|nr:structural protein [Rhodospirillales bacterium]
MNHVPRGIRNRNPGNIRKSRDRWKGLAPLQPDPAFFVFEAPLWGIRAMAVILRKYQRRHGLKTLAQIIARWAPAAENDTAGYLAAVSKTTGIGSRAQLDLSDGVTLRALIAAIIRHENGLQPYDLRTIDLAIDLA